jgi:hypothetical protein
MGPHTESSQRSPDTRSRYLVQGNAGYAWILAEGGRVSSADDSASLRIFSADLGLTTPSLPVYSHLTAIPIDTLFRYPPVNLFIAYGEAICNAVNAHTCIKSSGKTPSLCCHKNSFRPTFT